MSLFSHVQNMISGISVKFAKLQHPEPSESMPPGSDVVKDGGNLQNGSASRGRRTTILSVPDTPSRTPTSLKKRRSEPKPPLKRRSNGEFVEMVPKTEEVEVKPELLTLHEPADVATTTAKKPQKANKNGRRVPATAEIFSRKLGRLVMSGYDLDDCSDTEIEGSAKEAMICDSTRNEITYGVQELAHPEELPQMETVLDDLWLEEKADFSYPQKMIACDVTVPYFNNSAFMTPPISPQAYQVTAQDEVFVAKINADRQLCNGVRYLDMDTFRRIISQLEIDTYVGIHENILDELHAVYTRPPEVGTPEEEKVQCDICGDADCGNDDEMIFCDMCNTCVHCSCAGITVVPPHSIPWKCLKCARFGKPSPPCALCPVLGGSMVCDESGTRWAHHVCALFHPEVEFVDADTRYPIESLELIHPDRIAAKCVVCDTNQGATIGCVEPGCEEQFHVCCALRAGLPVRITEKSNVPDNIFRETRCHRHVTDPMQLARMPEIYKSGRFAECTNPRLAEQEHSFYLVTDYEKIAKKLNLEEIVVSDVYEYWKLCRLANNSRPLMPKLHQHITIQPDITNAAMKAAKALAERLPAEQNEPGRFFPRAALMVTELRQQHLKRARRNIEDTLKLFSMLEQREQLKKKQFHAEAQVVKVAMDAVKRRAHVMKFSTSEELRFPDDLLQKAWKIPKEQIRKAQEPANFNKYVRSLEPQYFFWPGTSSKSSAPLRPRNTPTSSATSSGAAAVGMSTSKAAQRAPRKESMEEEVQGAKRRAGRSRLDPIG